MPKLSADDIRGQIELLQRDIDDAKRPEVVRRYPALAHPEIVARRLSDMSRLRKLLRQAEGGDSRTIAESYEFQVGTTLVCTEDKLTYVFLGWSTTGPGGLPIFGALIPHTLDVRRRSPSRVTTLDKLFPDAHYYVRARAVAEPAPRRTARKVKRLATRAQVVRPAAASPTLLRVEHAYNFPVGAELTSRRGRVYVFQGWRDNKSGRVPEFLHKNPESGKDWTQKPAFEETLLRQFPDADRFRIPDLATMTA